jgi:hypothetical protein
MVSRADLCCPNCGADLAVEELFGHEVDHRAFLHLAHISIPLGARVMRYLQLFAPPKNRLTMARKSRLIEQLLPDLQRQQINHNGRDWHAPLAAWAIAIDGMLQARDLGKLRLPLTGHGYLYAVIAGMADKVERGDEENVELARRQGVINAAGALDSLDPALQETQQAIAARKPHVFHSAADVLAANPHLMKEIKR